VGLIKSCGYATDDELRGRVHLDVRQFGFPADRWITVEASRGVVEAPIGEEIRMAPLSMITAVFERAGSGTNVAVSCNIAAKLVSDPDDVDPEPQLQPPHFG
jgi:hypothetical protein